MHEDAHGSEFLEPRKRQTGLSDFVSGYKYAQNWVAVYIMSYNFMGKNMCNVVPTTVSTEYGCR